MIDNAKLKIKPMSERMKRKTGDKSNYKEFAGNIKLLMSSYNSIADLKSNTFHLIVCDEVDEMGAELKGQGDVAGIIEGRTLGLRRYKVLYISTPSDMRTSRIHKAYLEGDQRQYNMPCPVCGELQVLELMGAGKDYGLTFSREKNHNGKKLLVPESVRYVCKICKKEFYHSKKQWMLENGIWIPTHTPDDAGKVSYHSSGLISPFLSWERICQQFINTNFGQDVLKFKDFTINYLGNAWATTTKTPEWQELKDRSEDYCIGEVPEGEMRDYGGYQMPHCPLALYGGVDVQGDRLELHVVGFGADKEKWPLIDYKIFHGKPESIDDSCWIALDDYVYNHTYKICGIECRISRRCGIDSGYDPGQAKRVKDFSNKANVVYDFVYPRQDRFTAVMGYSTEKTIGIIKEAKINDIRTPLTKRYNVHVSLIKEMIMEIIEQKEGVGTIHFPKWQMIGNQKKIIPDDKYKRFLSERYQEIKPGVFGWVKIHERNEDLDTFNYAWAMAEYEGVTNWSYETWYSYYLGLIE